MIETIQIVKIINCVSIRLTYINFIKLYLTYFSNKKGLNNLSNSAFILVTGTMGEIDESKAGARYSWLPISWSLFLWRVYWTLRTPYCYCRQPQNVQRSPGSGMFCFRQSLVDQPAWWRPISSPSLCYISYLQRRTTTYLSSPEKDERSKSVWGEVERSDHLWGKLVHLQRLQFDFLSTMWAL